MAFGKDIKKANVRFVIYGGIPSSFFDYYKLTRLAGRDGNLAECIIFYNENDVGIQQRLKAKDSNSSKVQNSPMELRNIESYCENNVQCRRSLLSINDDNLSCKEDQVACDNCAQKVFSHFFLKYI